MMGKEHKQDHNRNPKATQKANQDPKRKQRQRPIKKVVFPLYGGETGENGFCKIPRGLNSLRKGKMHLFMNVYFGRPIKCGLLLLARGKSP